MFHLKGAPSSVRNEPRKRFVQECGSSPVRECSSKMLRPGPFVCAGERKVVIAVSAHVGLPLRCRGALGDAVLRSFGCWMSPLMRWRWSGRSMSGCRYRCRCGRGCRCCPRRCRVLAGDSDYRVLHGVDVLFGHRALRGFGGRRHRGVSSLRALTAAMRIARKRNRSPQNGAGRDDGSSQCSLL